MANDLSIEASEFEAKVLNSELPVFVDFWAPWCGPCKRVAPLVETLATEYAGRVTVYKVDIEENSEMAADLGIMSIPSFIAFKGGKEVTRVIGADEKQMRELLDTVA